MASLKDGDHPDNIVVTYGRCNAALELVEDLTRIFRPDELASLSLRMLNKDLLADDEWWFALHRRRYRHLGRPCPTDLPSYCTRVSAGHQLAAVVLGLGLAGDAGAVELQPEGTAPFLEPWDYPLAQRAVWGRSLGVCEAEGLHHPNCPGEAGDDPRQQVQFVTHHIYPREAAKRDRVPVEIAHNPRNLVLVWNGYTGKGAGGCHGRIHRERTSARRLGLLARKLPGPWLPDPDPDPSTSTD